MQWAAPILGLVYALAGLAGWRRARMNAFMDRALAGLSLKPVPRVEQAVGAWLYMDAALLAATGAGLMLATRWGAVLAVAVVIEQGVFCLWSERFYPARHPADAHARQSALVVVGFYAALAAAATALAYGGALR